MSTPSHLAQTAAGEAAQAAPPASATRARPNAGLAGIELPFGLTPFNLALLAMLVGAFVVFRRYDPPALTFDESALQNIGNVFASLFLVAAFIERAIEVILTPIRGDDANRFQALIEAHRAAGEHDAAAKIESELAEHRLGSRRRAFLLAVGLGMLAAVLGVADQPLMDRIDDEIEAFERNLADEHGTIIGNFGDVARKISALYR